MTQMGWDGGKFHRATQNDGQFRTQESFLSQIPQLIVFEEEIAERMENQTTEQ